MLGMISNCGRWKADLHSFSNDSNYEFFFSNMLLSRIWVFVVCNFSDYKLKSLRLDFH